MGGCHDRVGLPEEESHGRHVHQVISGAEGVLRSGGHPHAAVRPGGAKRGRRGRHAKHGSSHRHGSPCGCSSPCVCSSYHLRSSCVCSACVCSSCIRSSYNLRSSSCYRVVRRSRGRRGYSPELLEASDLVE